MRSGRTAVPERDGGAREARRSQNLQAGGCDLIALHQPVGPERQGYRTFGCVLTVRPCCRRGFRPPVVDLLNNSQGIKPANAKTGRDIVGLTRSNIPDTVTSCEERRAARATPRIHPAPFVDSAERSDIARMRSSSPAPRRKARMDTSQWTSSRRYGDMTRSSAEPPHSQPLRQSVPPTLSRLVSCHVEYGCSCKATPTSAVPPSE